MPQRTPRSVFQLRIELEDVELPIWRRLLVPGEISMAGLAQILLTAMGWANAHLHAFRAGRRRYGMHLDNYPDDEIDENTIRVVEVLSGLDVFMFDYDFGDGWEHRVAIEEVVNSTSRLIHAVCLEGANACPPEDVGGPSGYSSLLESVADPDRDNNDWTFDDQAFDPAVFNLAETNVLLQQLRGLGTKR